jgi:hypothetical protein
MRRGSFRPRNPDKSRCVRSPDPGDERDWQAIADPFNSTIRIFCLIAVLEFGDQAPTFRRDSPENTRRRGRGTRRYGARHDRFSAD